MSLSFPSLSISVTNDLADPNFLLAFLYPGRLLHLEKSELAYSNSLLFL